MGDNLKELLLYCRIRQPARAARLARFLADYGVAIQPGLYELRLAREWLPAFRKRLQALIDPREDSVKIFGLCAACRRRSFRHESVKSLPEEPDWLII